MKFPRAVILGCMLLSVQLFAGPVRKAAEPVENEYIVVLKDTAAPTATVAATASETALRHGGRVLTVLANGLRAYGIEVTAERAARIADDPRVAWVEENGYGHLSYDVEYYSSDAYYHLDRVDQRTPVPLHSFKAYGWTSTGRNVDVYVVDTGIQSAHTEFANGNVAVGADYAAGDGYTPTNPCGGFINRYNGGHGTSVASIIGGRTVGVARNARLIPVKVGTCNRNPSPANPELRITALSVLWGLDWILAQVQANPGRRAVVNMSLYFDILADGVTTNPACVDQNGQPLRDANGNLIDCRAALDNNVRNLLNAGVVVVASANNQNQNRCAQQSPSRMGYGGMHDPGNQPTWPYAIIAGGTDINDNRFFCASCSSTQNGSNFGPCVGIYAPAHRIRSAHIASSTAYRDEQQWVDALMNEGIGYINVTVENVSTGTSFAAPLTAGVAARLLETFPGMTVRQVWDHIRNNATALPANFDGDGVAANDRLLYISVYH